MSVVNVVGSLYNKGFIKDMDNIQLKIDKTLKDIWLNILPKEYNNHNLLKEDSLKCVIYYYLRTHLGDGWLNRHRIRIFPEFYLTQEMYI